MCGGVEQLHFVSSQPGRQCGGWGRSRTRSRGCGREGKIIKFIGKRGVHLGVLGVIGLLLMSYLNLKKWRFPGVGVGGECLGSLYSARLTWLSLDSCRTSGWFQETFGGVSRLQCLGQR
jgi:hypothetical protein